MKYFQLVCLLVLLTACGGYRPAGSAGVYDGDKGVVSGEQVSDPVSLTDYLQRLPGLNITGNGANAEIRIGGPISFNAEQRPLFVVDGVKMGNDYSSLYANINPRDIDRVRVLKGGNETAIYGAQGSAGVIEIYTKKG